MMPLRKSHQPALPVLLALAAALALPAGALAADATATFTAPSGAVVDSTTIDPSKPGEAVAAIEATASGAQSAVPSVTPGALLGAGDNSLGELGLATTGDEENFWQSGSATDWTAVASGTNAACGIRSGALYCWGYGGLGQLGVGKTVSVTPVPTQVGTATNWASVAAGDDHTCAITTTSVLSCWGNNSYGKLGTNGTADAVAPVVVGSGWRSVSLGQDSTCGVKTDGSAWCWGYGGSGQLGNGTTFDLRLPSAVWTTQKWKQVVSGGYHTCGVTTGGALYCWGDNNLGEAGVGNTTKQKLPVRVGTDSDWNQVSAGFDSTCATKTTGALLCWGYGGSGQLGLGNTTSISKPARVGTDADWTTVSESRYGTCAKKSDTTLWCWGYNAQGQLGFGDHVQRSLPQQVTTPISVDVISTGSTSDRMLLVSQDTTPVNACDETPTTQAFAGLGDVADYSLAPGGDFEGPLTDWSLNNSRVVSGNETVGILPGSKSLQIGGPTGGSAKVTTPAFCINADHPSFRYLVKNNGGSNGYLFTSLRFRLKSDPAFMIQLTTRTTVASGSSWQASDQIPLATLIASSLLKKGGNVQVLFSTTGDMQIDNLLIDPYRRG